MTLWPRINKIRDSIVSTGTMANALVGMVFSLEVPAWHLKIRAGEMTSSEG